MKKHLFLICPTDNLEVIINRTFKEDNYYFTSLANTIMFDVDQVGLLTSFIETKQISEVTFILSDDNKIIEEALFCKDYTDNKFLKKFYLYIKTQNKRFRFLTEKQNPTSTISSYYLNDKVKILTNELSSLWFSHKITVNAKIYKRKKNRFYKTSFDTFYRDYFYLN